MPVRQSQQQPRRAVEDTASEANLHGRKKMRRPALLPGLTLLAVIALAGCSTWPFNYAPNFSWTHRIDIQQGTVVTKDMADKLQIGMTRDQVKFVLGTPLVADLFHADRWDYPYRFQPGRGKIQ